MEQKELNLLNESLGLHNNNLFGQLVLVEDTVDTSAAFVLHHILKLSFSSHPSSAVIFLALSHPFSHYDRILRKIVISLSLHLYFASLLFLLNLCVCFVFFSILGAGYLFFFYFIKLFNFLRFFFVVVSPDTSNWRGIDTCHWHMWLHWIMSFAQIIIGIYVSVCAQSGVCVCVCASWVWIPWLGTCWKTFWLINCNLIESNYNYNYYEYYFNNCKSLIVQISTQS